VVTADADTNTWMHFRSALTDDDVTSDDSLAAVFLDAEALAAGVTSVLDGTLSFFMGHVRRGWEVSGLACDRSDLKAGKGTAETDGLVETFAALEFERDAFRTTDLADDFCGNGSTGNRRGTDFHAVAFANENDLIEGDFRIDFDIELLDVEGVALLDAVLLTAGFDHCVGHGRIGKRIQPRLFGRGGEENMTPAGGQGFFLESRSWHGLDTPHMVSPMPRIAILSDIHANLPALTAVLAEVRKSGITEIYFGGDTVGYAAKVEECVDFVRHHGGRSVLGNHDYYTNAVIANEENIPGGNGWAHNPVWAGVVHAARTLSPDNAHWLAELPGYLKIPGGILSHASLHFPETWPYLHSSGDAAPTLDILEEKGYGIGFFGHTHQQTFFTRRSASGVIAKRVDYSKVLLPEGAICAVLVGSVGQPRDLDERAAWVTWDSDTRIVEFRRTAYPALETARQILEARLPEISAMRLLDESTAKRLFR
jgi:diadenosine tetraphosphatase ApaH/serine/threonine PP2A family protein phosphatase